MFWLLQALRHIYNVLDISGFRGVSIIWLGQGLGPKLAIFHITFSGQSTDISVPGVQQTITQRKHYRNRRSSSVNRTQTPQLSSAPITFELRSTNLKHGMIDSQDENPYYNMRQDCGAKVSWTCEKERRKLRRLDQVSRVNAE